MSEPAVELLEETWSAIAELCGDLDEHDWDAPTDLPGWTVRDVVSHIIGTERMLRGDTTPPAPAATGPHVLNPIGEINEAWVEERRGRPGEQVLAELREITTERLATLRALPQEEWERMGFTPEGEGPYRRFMEIRAFDCWEHEQDIRRAVGRPGHLEGPVAEHSLARITAALGYIVGKRAAAPEGSSVVFDVTGPITMRLPVVVQGRARLSDTPVEQPTVTITLDTETFNALACGRWSAEVALAEGRASLSGDTELGRTVLDNMAFTI